MQVIFAERPKQESIGNGLARSISKTEYKFAIKKRIYKLVIPEGFIFDGASIPRMFWTLLGLSPHGDMDGPALPHDFGYHNQGRLPEGSLFFFSGGGWIECNDILTKGLWDELLRELCVYFKVCGKIRAYTVWSAVFCCGWFSWWRNDEKRKMDKFDTVVERATR